MIITCSYPYGIIKAQLKKYKKIAIVACNSCAKACETGGKEAMEKLAERLRADEFDVIEEEIVPMACMIDLAKKHDYQADILIMLGCKSGLITFQEIFPKKTIIPGTVTIGIGARGTNGLYVMKSFIEK